MYSKVVAALACLGVMITACSDHWMLVDLRLPDGRNIIRLEHRWEGDFLTSVRNEFGVTEIKAFGPGNADSRHVNLYLSPSGHLIIADYATQPAIVDISGRQAPKQVINREVERREYADASRWRYIGVVRRTGSEEMRFLRFEEECQQWAYGPPVGPSRTVKHCRDVNYGGNSSRRYVAEGDKV
jgi:hypothetical protein